mgnify:CR=1 FL=1
MAYDHSCLVTTLKNKSGRRLRYGFIPPHGVYLDAGEEINVVGNILEAVNRGDRFGNRHMNALLDALDADLIEIVSTPAPIFYDETLGITQMITIDNGAVVLADPCWETRLSESVSE